MGCHHRAAAQSFSPVLQLAFIAAMAGAAVCTWPALSWDDRRPQNFSLAWLAHHHTARAALHSGVDQECCAVLVACTAMLLNV